MNKDGSSKGGSAVSPTSSMWGKKGRGYPELAKDGKDKGGKK